MRKKIIVTTKAKAARILAANPGALVRERYDRGKYAHNGAGKEVEVAENVQALWMERRQDRHGPYYASYCLVPREDYQGCA